MDNSIKVSGIAVPEDTLQKWQTIVDCIAELIDIPAALLMRLVDTNIEVYVSSQSEGNPYRPGDHDHFLGSGLYCETVIRKNSKLLIPNALKDEHWKTNPDIKLNMISYLGYPIYMPDGAAFGTICVLDSKENAYSSTVEKLMVNFRDVIQAQLELMHMNIELGETNKSVTDYLNELKTLRGIVPICAFCKKIRDTEGQWNDVDVYVSKHTEAQFSHGYCPECMQIHFSDELHSMNSGPT